MECDEIGAGVQGNTCRRMVPWAGPSKGPSSLWGVNCRGIVTGGQGNMEQPHGVTYVAHVGSGNKRATRAHNR